MIKDKWTTAEKILRAAEEIFVVHGFSGASINAIACQAKVHKSLIYHHFDSKEKLWVAVKESILGSHCGQALSEITFPMDSFKVFLKSVMTFRFELYDHNPSMARLIAWQRLEKVTHFIEGVTDKKFTTLAPQVMEFQRRGEVCSHVDPEMISYLILTTSSSPFIDKPSFFHEGDIAVSKQKFLDMIIEALYKAFAFTK